MRVPIIGQQAKKKPRPRKRKVKVWTCGNCGHQIPTEADGQLNELDFKQFDERTSKVACPNCGSYTIQRHRGKFKTGRFLVVKARLK